MSKIGYGYGSEWHLLRYLGHHRGALDGAIKKKMGDVKVIEWFDFRFDSSQKLLDAELKGVEFLRDDEPAKEGWPKFWPDKGPNGLGNVPNWDAVALLTINNNDRVWMLVEAKAHVGEIGSPPCGATNKGSIETIKAALEETKARCGVGAGPDWMKTYYQHANRLAVLHYFVKSGAEARLLNIYFTGDKNPHGKCPKTWEEWKEPLHTRDECLGLTGKSPLEKRVYSLCLPVCGENVGYGGSRVG